MYDPVPMNQVQSPLPGPVSTPSITGIEAVDPFDALLEQFVQTLKSAPATAPPPTAQLSNPERLALGVLAATDPQGYRDIGLPFLRDRNAAAAQLAAQPAQEHERKLQTMSALLDVEQVREQRQRGKLAEQKEQARLDKEQGKLDREREAVLANLDVSLNAFKEVLPGIQAAVEHLQATGDPVDAATAEIILSRAKRVASQFQRLDANRDAIEKKDVETIQKDIQDLEPDMTQALQSARTAAQSRTAEEATMARFLMEQGKPGEPQKLSAGARTDLTEGLGTLRGVADFMGMMQGVDFNRFSALGPRSEKFKKLLASGQGLVAPVMKALIGAGQTESEAAKNAAIFVKVGSPPYGDRESVQAGMEAIQSMIIRGYLSRLDQEEDAGVNVSIQRKRIQSEIFPTLPPRTLAAVTPVPEDVPPGSILIDATPNRRVYQLPDGSIAEWTPSQQGAEARQLQMQVSHSNAAPQQIAQPAAQARPLPPGIPAGSAYLGKHESTGRDWYKTPSGEYIEAP